MSNNLDVVKLVGSLLKAIYGSGKSRDITKCIICQNVRNGRVTSDEWDREKWKGQLILEMAWWKKRLRYADEFVYHT